MTSGERPGLSPRARVLLPIFLIVLVGLSVQRLGCTGQGPGAPAPPPLPVAGGVPLAEFGGETMGTRYSIKLASQRPLDAGARRRVDDAVQKVLLRVDEVMSSYRPDSEVNRLSQHRSSAIFRMSPDLAPVMRAAQEISRQSGGALDVTVRPLVDAWGFGPNGPRKEPPDARRITELLGQVGYRRLEVGDHVVTKRHVDLAVDLSAIAKGYAVDKVSEALARLGHEAHLVEIGGELRAAGSRSPGHPWQVAIERPDAADRTVQRVLPLVDLSIATSGDYRNYFESDGVRYSHLIDPRTGRPVAHDLASVTVVHPSAMMADGWATALAVLGPREGLKLAVSRGLAAFFLVRESSGGFTSTQTPDFDALQRGEYLADDPSDSADPGPVPADDPGDGAGGDAVGP